jgi:hypothetical protein
MTTLRDINDSVEFIYKQGAKYAEAKAHRVYLEEFRKSQKAMLMKAAQADGRAKTAAAAEIEAYSDPAYIQILQGLQEAVEKEETFRWALVAAQARIEVYRTQSANERAFEKGIS